MYGKVIVFSAVALFRWGLLPIQRYYHIDAKASSGNISVCRRYALARALRGLLQRALKPLGEWLIILRESNSILAHCVRFLQMMKKRSACAGSLLCVLLLQKHYLSEARYNSRYLIEDGAPDGARLFHLDTSHHPQEEYDRNKLKIRLKNFIDNIRVKRKNLTKAPLQIIILKKVEKMY